MAKPLKAIILVGAALVGALFIPVGGGAAVSPADGERKSMDLSSHSSDAPKSPLNMLFIHHSCGGQLLAEEGPEKELANCILITHPNGGGMRAGLEKQGYVVNEASYGSIVGEDTDMFHWLPKFKSGLDRILSTAMNDKQLPEGTQNQIVAFKSCYPNNRFESEGEAPGKAEGPELTVYNAKASMNGLRDVFASKPEVLFVYFTAPPNAPMVDAEPAWKWLAKKAMGKPSTAEIIAKRASLARQFNRWVSSPEGWLKGYEGTNVVVFDYYDVLTGGAGNLSKFPTGDGSDSHPSSSGNRTAAAAFVPFLNRAVHRAGLVE